MPKTGSSREVGAQPARGSILHRAGHAVFEVGNVFGDIERALDLGLERGHFFRRGGMLQVVERSAVGDGGHKRAQLQRSERNSLAEAAHAAYAAL